MKSERLIDGRAEFRREYEVWRSNDRKVERGAGGKAGRGGQEIVGRKLQQS